MSTNLQKLVFLKGSLQVNVLWKRRRPQTLLESENQRNCPFIWNQRDNSTAVGSCAVLLNKLCTASLQINCITSFNYQTNHDCDLCPAVQPLFSTPQSSLAMVHATSQQQHCQTEHSSIVLLYKVLSWQQSIISEEQVGVTIGVHYQLV